MVNTNLKEDLEREVFETLIQTNVERKLLRISRHLTINAHFIKSLPKQNIFYVLSFWMLISLYFSLMNSMAWAISLYYEKGPELRPNLFACVSVNFLDRQSTRNRREHWKYDHTSICHSREEHRTWRENTEKFNETFPHSSLWGSWAVIHHTTFTHTIQFARCALIYLQVITV